MWQELVSAQSTISAKKWLLLLNVKEFPDGSAVQESACHAGDQEMWDRSLGQEDTLEEEMATHSNILAWEIPWREEGA